MLQSVSGLAHALNERLVTYVSARDALRAARASWAKLADEASVIMEVFVVIAVTAWCPDVLIASTGEP